MAYELPPTKEADIVVTQDPMGKLKKKSPLKLLSLLGPGLDGMVFTLQGWSLGGPLSELCLTTPLANQDGCPS